MSSSPAIADFDDVAPPPPRRYWSPEETARVLAKALSAAADADMAYYCHSLATDPHEGRVAAENCATLARLGHMKGAPGAPRKRVLDVGCGYGWEAAAVALMADCSVVANDIRPVMTQGVDRLIAHLRHELGVSVDVRSLLGDICGADSRLERESFDAIMSNQAIEHVHDLDGMFGVCRSLLRPGGWLVLTNDNNVYNTAGVQEIEQLWRRRDRDWDHIRELQAKKPNEMQGIEPYAVTRQRLIREAAPQLADEHVAKLVDATAGMLDREIQALASRWQPGQSLPTPPRWSWCRDPVSGEYVERQLDPFEIAQRLRDNGFGKVQVRHTLRRWPLRLVNGIRLRPLNQAIFKRKAKFAVVAQKPRTGP